MLQRPFSKSGFCRADKKNRFSKIMNKELLTFESPGPEQVLVIFGQNLNSFSAEFLDDFFSQWGGCIHNIWMKGSTCLLIAYFTVSDALLAYSKVRLMHNVMGNARFAYPAKFQSNRFRIPMRLDRCIKALNHYLGFDSWSTSVNRVSLVSSRNFPGGDIQNESAIVVVALSAHFENLVVDGIGMVKIVENDFLEIPPNDVLQECFVHFESIVARKNVGESFHLACTLAKKKIISKIQLVISSKPQAVLRADIPNKPFLYQDGETMTN